MEVWEDLTQSQKWKWAQKAQLVHKRAKPRSPIPIQRITGRDLYELALGWWFECAYCRRELTRNTMTFDHVLALALGGEHSYFNLVPACASCNQKKSVNEGHQRHAVRMAEMSNLP